MNAKQLVKFENEEIILNVAIGVNNDAVWLTQEDMVGINQKDYQIVSNFF